MNSGRGNELGKQHDVLAPLVSPWLLAQPRMRAALAARDIEVVYGLVIENGASQYDIAHRTGQSQSEVHDILHKGRQVTWYAVLKRIADGLGVPRGVMGLAYDEHTETTYAEGVMVANHPDGEVDEHVKRRNLVTFAAFLTFGAPVLGKPEQWPLVPAADTPLPLRLSEADVIGVRSVTEQMRTLARFYGGGAGTISEAAIRYTQLMTVDGDEPVKRALGSELAEMHTVAGWSCFDSGHDGRAHFARAMELAHDAGDPIKHADALYYSGVATGEKGGYNEALQLFQMGQFRLADAAPNDPKALALSGWLHLDSASALAHLDRPDMAKKELFKARDMWQPEAADGQADMEWVVGLVERDLGRFDAAEQFVTSSVRRWNGSSDHRQSVLADITLAELHVRAREPRGLTLSHHAITGVSQLRSQRARARLVPLADALAARPGSDARELARMARKVAATRV